jgi:flagellar hook-length control protein FliK
MPTKSQEAPENLLRAAEVRISEPSASAPLKAEAAVIEPARSQTEKVIEQIANAARLEMGQGKKEITVRLEPPELGKVQVRVSSEGGIVSTRLEVAAPAVRDLLEANLEGLRAALQKANVEMGQCTVSLGAGWQGEAANGRGYRTGEVLRRTRLVRPAVQPASGYSAEIRRPIGAEGAAFDRFA